MLKLQIVVGTTPKIIQQPAAAGGKEGLVHSATAAAAELYIIAQAACKNSPKHSYICSTVYSYIHIYIFIRQI